MSLKQDPASPDCPLFAGPVSRASTGASVPPDGRANLLESIRNAGGIGKAKLRDVQERKMEKKKQKEQEQGVRFFECGCSSALVFLSLTQCSFHDEKDMQSMHSVTNS